MKLVNLKANKDHFREVVFRDGLNLVLAERTEVSKDTDSRNGVGKTTLFQIIDFCLGGRVGKGDSLEKLQGSDWEFTLQLSFEGDRQLAVTRALDDSGVVRLLGDVAELGVGDSSPASIGPKAWTGWLGQLCFQLPTDAVRGEYDPTFRRLFGHFLRFRADAYVSPFETFGKQPPHQTQADNAFLLGLDWKLATEWQRWKDRGKALGVLGRTDLDELGERLGELESQRVRSEAQRRRLSEQIENFEVLPEYREVERRTNDVTGQMQALANAITVNARLLELYRGQLATEHADDAEAVLSTFEEAGVVFGEALTRTVEDIVSFHTEVARNRREYLAAEVARVEREQAEKRDELERLETQRRSDLQLLATHGALDDFAHLQQRLGSAAAATEALTRQIEELREIRKGKAALKVAQVDLQQRTALDVEQRLPTIAGILEDFSETFEEAYGEAADLVVDVGEAGYQFRVSLPRQGSHGVGKVGVFAYDLAITNSWARQDRGTGFLGHDSVIFDGVDERQKSAAISRAIGAADSNGFQYILTINSDDLPSDELIAHSVDVSSFTVLTLTDADPAGGLLGIRV
ncbi:DUF2326 domain-containing protein [Nocardioides daeguensis]|uniref:DUF2326 domain-containing protein n=1 Tax=Nocardioides daeguensis TaxID=908359 RepID=A0ABP6VS86_9ACTN|nr:DUF2326 domain-containing protein [Nocardioides daeguensis]MBV6728582.1 DUF2326 domain-containing protein [Nocardioides daeguensis]MCR1774006.1 DUF2326 domain-containing protein [Nocardioides daeguensis]